MADDDVVPFAGDLFFDTSYRSHHFEFGEYSQTVDALIAASVSMKPRFAAPDVLICAAFLPQTDLDLTGQVIWPGASFLSW